ncbi:phosphoribosylglycinamide formyltransferase [Nakamurella silvestris]|nr:phosphoribosylglycinamide formyltransferase [Nakamurella silvestris]
MKYTCGNPAKIVILASGSGTLAQALIDAATSADGAPYEIVAIGSDLAACTALDRAATAGIPTFTVSLKQYASRAEWDAALAQACLAHGAELVVLAGFMKLVGEPFLAALPGRVINAHPSLLPSFPGMYAPADALNHGVKLTGCTVFLVDGGIDAGPIVAQRAVEVADDDDVESLHERIKIAERSLLVDVVTAMSAGGWQVEERKVILG